MKTLGALAIATLAATPVIVGAQTSGGLLQSVKSVRITR